MKLEKRLDNIQILLDTYILPALEQLQKNAEMAEINKKEINQIIDWIGGYRYKNRRMNVKK